MPVIGGVYIPDELAPRLEAPNVGRGRPGLGAVFGAAAKGAYGAVRYGLPYQAKVLTGTLDYGDPEFYQQGLQRAAQEASKAAPASVDDLTSGRAGFGSFVAENVVASLPYMAGMLAGGVAGGVVGGAPGAFAGATAAGVPLFSGTNVARSVEEAGELTPDAATRSLAVAPVQAAADTLIGRFLPGVGKTLGGAAATQGAKTFAGRTAQSMAKAAGTEAVTEASQQIGERYAAGLNLSDADAVAEYVNAAVVGMTVGGVFGAGGGFRRTNAVAKPAEQVEVPDLQQHIDQILGIQQELPLQGGSATEQQLEFPDTGPVQPEAPASQLPQLPLDPGLSGVPEGTQLELGQRVRDDIEPPAPPAPPQLPGLAAQPVDIQQAMQGLSGIGPQAPQTSALAFQGPASGVQPVALPDGATRPFRGDPIEEIEKIARSSADNPAVRAARTEIRLRREEAAGTRELTTDDFSERLAEAKRGLRGGFVNSVEAKTPQELQEKVYDQIFVEADTRANTVKFAQRLGILDENMEPGTAAREVEARRAQTAAASQPATTTEPVAAPPAAPAPVAEPAPQAAPEPQQDPAFEEEWRGILKDAGIQRLRGAKDLPTPPNRAAAEAAIIQSLATDSSDAQTSQVERIAQQMGLITNDDARDITPAGRRAYLETSDGFKAIVQAAQSQGYTGAAASQFERAARAAMAGQPITEGELSDVQIASAATTWVQDFIENGPVKTAAQTEKIRARQAKRRTGEARGREDAPRAQLTPLQVQQQGLNRLLDSAVTSSISDTDRATLRRMVRDGVAPSEVVQALQRAQQGQPLFEQSDRQEYEAPRADPRRGGQPVYQELRGRERDDVLRLTGQVPSKAAMRAETERARIAADLESLIEFAEIEEAITPRRAAAMRKKLVDGKIDEVARLLKDFDPDYIPPPPKKEKVAKIKDPVAVTQAVVHDQLTGREKAVIAKHYGEKTYNKTAKAKFAADVRTAISEGVQAVAEALRVIIRRIEAGVLAAAMVFNPVALTTPGGAFDLRPLGQPAGQTKMAVKPVAPKAAGMSKTATLAYERLAPVAANRGSGFMIVDKANSKLHMFRADGGHIASDTVLTGATKSDFYSETRANISSIDELVANGERVTPAGQFTTRVFKQKNAEGQPLGLMLVDSNGKSSFVAIHTTTIDTRLQQLGTEATTDNAVTLGCVSIDPEFYEKNVAPDIEALADNLVFVLPYDETQLETMLPEEQLLVVDGPSTDPLRAADPRGDADGITPGDRQRVTDARTRRGRKRLTIPEEDAADIQPAQTVADANDLAKQAVARAVEFSEKINVQDLGVRMRRVVLGWLSSNQIERAYGAQNAGLAMRNEAHREQTAVRARIDQMGDEVYQRFEALEQRNKKAAEWVGQLMAMTTEFQVDPAKTWAEHTHLQDKPNQQGLRAMYDASVKLANDMKRGNGEAWATYEEFRALNEAQNLIHMAVRLHGHVALDPELVRGVTDADINPMDVFMREEGVVTPQQVRDRWVQLLDAQIAATNKFVQEKKGAVSAGTDKEQLAMRAHLSPIEHQIRAIYEARGAMENAPYFHMGRFGNYFGAATIANNEGIVDKAALAKVDAALREAGIENIQFSSENTKPNFMIRFETVDQTERFKKLMLKLQAEGLLAEDSIKAGPRTVDTNWGVQQGLPDYVQRYIQSIEASPMFVAEEGADPKMVALLAERKEAAVRLAIDTWLEQQPDTSISKVLVKRYAVPGYDPNMIRNFAHRWRIGSVAIAGGAARPKFNRAYTEMRAQVEQAKLVTEEQQTDPYLAADLMNEMRLRDAADVLGDNVDAFDKLRAISHSYFLGFSPAYGMINLTQLGVTAMPELAKKHGYRKSFSAMRYGSATAGKILKAAMAEARTLGWKNWADVAITERVLERAKLSSKERNFVLAMIATGTIDIGSAARALGQVEQGRQGSGLDTYLKYASGVGLYTETFTRLTTALAAGKLHQGTAQEAEAYAAKVVSDTMFDYQSWNTARQLGKQGFLGKVTPIVTQFMSYTVQVTEKIYAEFMDSVRRTQPGETEAEAAQRRKEARTWMFGHITAVTALAGTLGMPFATAFAAAIERLVDTFDDDEEPYDAMASYRNFLASVLGQDAAEVVARGIPRALGFDISQRAGEADLLPFSALLSDRRTLKESLGGYLERAIGASPSMLLNIAEGADKFTDGDVLEGMKLMVPIAFKGPIETYRMTQDGYVDTRGNRLPISPTASSYMWQLLGFSPANKAEYGEARRTQQARRGTIAREATKLRRQIIDAMMEGDNETAREKISEAMKFDQDNPAFAVVPSLAGAMQRRATQRMQSQALQTPLGVSLRDVAGQELTRYANVEYTQ